MRLNAHITWYYTQKDGNTLENVLNCEQEKKTLKVFLACVFNIEDWIGSLELNCSCGTLEKSIEFSLSLQKDKVALTLCCTIEVL